MTADRRFERAAVELAARGYFVFPCKPRGKSPLTKNGWQDATRDERTILTWWERSPDANIGIACGPSGIALLDIDSKHGADPRDVIAALKLAGNPIVWTGEAPEKSPENPDSLPGVRGAHVLFRGDLATGKTMRAGVELRSAGAYVIAPPSVHPSGVPYEGQFPPVAKLPDALRYGLDFILPLAGTSAPAPADDAELEPGGRHEGLLAWARSRLTARGTLGELSLDAMLGHNSRYCKPPLPDEEVRRLWRHLERSRIADKERAKAANAEPTGPEPATRITGRRVVLTPASEIRAERVRWLWPGWLPMRAVTIVAGEAGLGKSILTGAHLAAKVTRGELDGDLHG